METTTYVDPTLSIFGNVTLLWFCANEDQVHDMDFSLDGQNLLIISGTVQPKVFSRDGEDE